MPGTRPPGGRRSRSFLPGRRGAIDGDTAASARSWDAAVVAAGGGVDAIERLKKGEGTPPSWPFDRRVITPRRSGPWGFACSTTSPSPPRRWPMPAKGFSIVDFDAHHGNGTQDTFYRDGRVGVRVVPPVAAVPRDGAGGRDRFRGRTGATVNLPFPPGTTGDVYLSAIDEVVVPVAERHDPTWLILSAGFDGHRADPLTHLGLSAGDFAEMTARLCGLVPAGRRLAVLEGGYDLSALADSTDACVAALAGERQHPEAQTGGGPGRQVVARAVSIHVDPR